MSASVRTPFIALVLALCLASPALAQEAPQTLTPTVTLSGLITTSIDGCGSVSATCTVQVQKPAGGVVRGAWLASATNRRGSTLPLLNGDVSINGSPVTWSQHVTNPWLYGTSVSHFADVTSIVKPIVDAAPPGLIHLTLTEAYSYNIDGSALVVVFDDPAQTTQGTVVLAFGTQDPLGDQFVLTLDAPFSDATQTITLSLAISGGNPDSYSTIGVNGRQMTRSAGGADDGQDEDGARITVGGIGDSESNPTDPGRLPSNSRSDDELYTLDRFIPAGSTNITVSTVNYLRQQNIFLATFIIRGTATTVSEDILLGPLKTALEGAAPNPVGASGTSFRFSLAEAAHVRLSVYDALGREVGRLADGPMRPGAYTLSWDGQDGLGRALAPGVYVVRLDAGTFAQSHRLTVVR